MWDDATDLFTSDAVLELADVGIYEGLASIRRFHERFGPQGLRYGQLNNRLIFNLLVSVSTAGRRRARAVSCSTCSATTPPAPRRSGST